LVYKQGQKLVEERKKVEEQKGIIDAQNQIIANQIQKISTLEGGLMTTMKWIKSLE